MPPGGQGPLPGRSAGPGAADRRGRRRRFLLRAGLPVLMLGGAVSAFAALMQSSMTLRPEAPGERVWTVETATVTRETTRARIPLFGQVVAGRSVDLRPLVTGRVTAVGPRFAEGNLVARGELLLTIDAFDYETARTLRSADLAEARAGLREAEADLAAATEQIAQDRVQLELLKNEAERRRHLHLQGAISQKSLDDAVLAFSRQQQVTSQRRNTVIRSQARVERQQAAVLRTETGLARAERDLAETRVVAPFEGWLVDVDVEVGKRVNTGERVARLVDASRLEIRMTIPNRIFGEIDSRDGAIGRRLEAVWRTGDTIRRFPARILRLEGEIDATSGGIAVFAGLEEAGRQDSLRAGAFVEVSLEGPLIRNGVRLPSQAVFDDERVYRIGTDDRLESVPVVVRAREDGTLLVQGPLEDGQRIVLTRFPEIARGVRVTTP